MWNDHQSELRDLAVEHVIKPAVGDWWNDDVKILLVPISKSGLKLAPDGLTDAARYHAMRGGRQAPRRSRGFGWSGNSRQRRLEVNATQRAPSRSGSVHAAWRITPGDG